MAVNPELQAAADTAGAPEPIVERVRDLYTRYPYPPPEFNERGRALFGELDYIRYALWPGRPDLNGLKVLDAGCGTGSGAVQIAYDYPDIEVVGIDLSETSLAAARAFADKLGVGSNLTLRQVAIEDVASLGESFDYIMASGVLHHMADPDAGLRALASVLKPAGGISVMVYAPHGRHGVYLLQDALRRLGGQADLPEQVTLARQVLASLPSTNPFKPAHWLDLQWNSDAGLVDLLLHVQDRSYSIPQIYQWLAQADLRLSKFFHPLDYDPLSYLGDSPELAERVARLAPNERAIVAELLHGGMRKHMFLATRTSYRPARLKPEGTIMLALRPTRSPLFLWREAERKRKKGRKTILVAQELHCGQTGQRTLDFDEAWQIAILEHCDGSRTAADIFGLPDVQIRIPGMTADEKLDWFGRFMELLASNEVLLFEP